jgi:hypothetical protein
MPSFISSIKEKLTGLKDIAKIVFYVLEIGSKRLLWVIENIEIEHRHFQTFSNGMCFDKHDRPIPWYTYSAIEYLSQFDYSDKNIYEYGSGNSSLFWAERCKYLRSVEIDESWFSLGEKNKKDNQTLFLARNETEYINTIATGNTKYDLIVIDGICRLDCAKLAVQFLKEGGIIILDNSDWFPKTSNFLRDSNLIQVDFTGIGPINYYTWTTSIFLHREVLLSPLHNRQPHFGIGSLVQEANPE